MSEVLFDLSRISGWRNLFFVFAVGSYSVTQADLDSLRPLYWASLVFFLLSAALERHYSKQKPIRLIARVPFVLWLLLVVGLCAASALWAIFPEAVLHSQYIPNVLYGTITICGMWLSIESWSDVVRFLKLYVISVLAMSLFLIFSQFLLGGFGRIGTVFDIVPNGPAMQMGFALMFCLMLYGAGNCSKKATVSIVVVLLLSIILTDSRKTMVASGLAIFLFVCYDKRAYLDLRKLVLAIPVVLVIVIAIFTIPFLNETIGYRLMGLLTGTFSDGSVDLSSLERDYYRETALKLFAERPFLGIGFEGFAAYLQSIGYWHVAYSHCNYTELLANLGVVGLVAYYSMYLTLIVRCIRYRQDSRFISYFILVMLFIRLVVEYGQVVYIDVDNYIVMLLMYASAYSFGCNPNSGGGGVAHARPSKFKSERCSV